MAFKDTSGTAVIDAVLTDIGRKRMVNGTFRVSKFALGDDEIDYSLVTAGMLSSDSSAPVLNTSLFEAYGSQTKNIQYGLNTFANSDMGYFPILKLNHKVDAAADLSGSVSAPGGAAGTVAGAESYYLCANNETADKLRGILTGSNHFKFLEDRNVEGNKIVLESGLDVLPVEDQAVKLEFFATFFGTETDDMPDDMRDSVEYLPIPVAVDYANREKYIIKKRLLDRNFFVMADSRFVEKVRGPSRDCSVFRNFADGTADINFQTTDDNAPITYGNQFEHYNTFIVDSVPNLMFDHKQYTYPSYKFSSLYGPKGSATALNFSIQQKLKVNSTGTRDYRYTKYGMLDQTLFPGYPEKFDYIETTLYVIGATSDARIQIPLRILRYSGT
jgi:hypothetical protein